MKLKKRKKPAILVVANPDGITPLATEGALYLAKYILDSVTDNRFNWYILPNLNPDAAAKFFEKVKQFDTGNNNAYNDDMDDQVDEDGPDDLNGDGFITQMLVASPDGKYIKDPKESRIVRKADYQKGEKGEYKIFSEGIDNDNDGQYNEDSQGGTNIGMNFPEKFQIHTAKGGKWPGSEDESYALMKFVSEHPEIAMTVTLGESDFCIAPFKGEGKPVSLNDEVKILPRYGKMLNISTQQKYTRKEVAEIATAAFPGNQYNEDNISFLLEKKPFTAPLAEDIFYYTTLSDKYTAFLKERGVDAKLMKPEKAKNGSFELWSYFQLGIPTFSMSLWEPLFLSDSVKNNDHLLLMHYDSIKTVTGFLPWTNFAHPQLGDVEIGGFIPYAKNTPAENQIRKMLSTKIPWIVELAQNLPTLTIGENRIRPLGNNLYELTIWIENNALIPFPTAMGKVNKHPFPAIVTLAGENIEILEGKTRTPVNAVPGLDNIKLQWVIKSDKKTKATITIESKIAGNDNTTIELK